MFSSDVNNRLEPKMSNQKGVIALGIPLLLLIIVAVILYILISQGIIKTKVPALSGQKKEPTVSLQTKYDNPFDGKFVNPFAGYKNPFDALK